MRKLGKAALLILAVGGCHSSDRARAHDSSLTTGTTADASSPSADSAKHFVQSFYDWYVPLGNGPASGYRYDSVLTRRADFAPALYAALRDDIAAQKTDTTGDLVSLSGEVDVFLNSQDPCERYEAGEATKTPPGFTVSIDARCSGSQGGTPAVLVDVERTGSTWRFVNFRSPQTATYDLMSALAQAAADRAKPVAHP